MAEALIHWMVPAGRGMQLEADPDELPPGALADAVNVDLARPYGTVRPRRGFISLSREAATDKAGHPASPLSNSAFDGSAEVLKLVYDESLGRVFALVRAGTDVDGDAAAKCYIGQVGGGGISWPATAVTGTFKIDPDRIPGTQLDAGRLFVATGSAKPYKNVVIDSQGAALFDTDSDPLTPAVPTLAPASGTGQGLNAITGFLYRTIAVNSRTSARSAASAASNLSGPVTNGRVNVTVTGVDLVANYDRIEIYRTTDGGAVYRFLAELANPGKAVTAVYTDTSPDDKLSYRTLPSRRGRPPTTRFVVKHNDRMLFCSKTDSPIDLDALYYSEPFAPMNVDPAVNLVLIGHRDGATPTLMFKLFNRVFVVKSDGAVYEVADNRPITPYRVDTLVSAGPWACIAPETRTIGETSAYWLCRQGLVEFNGQTPRLISQPIEERLAATPVAQSTLTSQTPGVTVPTVLDDGYHQWSGNLDAGTWRPLVAAYPTVIPTTKIIPTTSRPPGSYTGGAPLQAIDSSGGGAAESAKFQYYDGTWHDLPTGGLVIAAGPAARLFRAKQTAWTLLLPDVNYYIWADVWKANAPSKWKESNDLGTMAPSGAYQNSTTSGGSVSAYQSLLNKAHAVIWEKEQELWLFAPSTAAFSPLRIDTAWVLDLRSVGSEDGPQWRRHLVHATAACLARSLVPRSGDSPADALILGDSNGCLWTGPRGQIDFHIDRTTPLSEEQRITTATLSGAVISPTVSPAWPTTGAGLKGERLVARNPADGQTYTGLVTDNTAATLTVGWWLENRAPPAGVALEIALGGIDAHVDYHLSPISADDGHLAKDFRYFLLDGDGPQAGVDIEFRLADQAEQGLDAAALARQRRRRFAAFCGIGLRRIGEVGRGRYAGCRVGSHRPDRDWQLSAWGLALAAPTGRT